MVAETEAQGGLMFYSHHTVPGSSPNSKTPPPPSRLQAPNTRNRIRLLGGRDRRPSSMWPH